MASPKGGQPPIDPKSASKDFQTPATVRFNDDKDTQEILSRTIKLETVNQADYDAVFYPGGHGPLWDLAEDKNSIVLIESFYKNNKPIAAVCHAPAIFKHTKNTDGTSLVNGKKVTGFTNGEEEAVQLTSVVPFLLEDMLKSNGAIYSKKADWNPSDFFVDNYDGAGYPLKAADIGGGDTYGFNAFGAGIRFSSGGFSNRGQAVTYWETEESNTTAAYSRQLADGDGQLGRYDFNGSKKDANFIRCLKN